MFLVIQSIPLGLDTRTNMREAGAECVQHHEMFNGDGAYVRSAYDFVLNMGNTSLRVNDLVGCIVVNKPSDINQTRTPGACRQMFGDLMPHRPTEELEFPVDAWIKAPGQRGRGKFKKKIDWPLTLPSEWDCQLHIDGTEYRVITVGHRAVQGFQRTGPNRRRQYTWTGLANTPDNVLELARTAAGRLPHATLRAWDLIQDHEGQPYLLESNSSPAMNATTTERVRNEITRQIEEGRITAHA